jgi:hypothetical protein
MCKASLLVTGLSATLLTVTGSASAATFSVFSQATLTLLPGITASGGPPSPLDLVFSSSGVASNEATGRAARGGKVLVEQAAAAGTVPPADLVTLPSDTLASVSAMALGAAPPLGFASASPFATSSLFIDNSSLFTTYDLTFRLSYDVSASVTPVTFPDTAFAASLLEVSVLSLGGVALEALAVADASAGVFDAFAFDDILFTLSIGPGDFDAISLTAVAAGEIAPVPLPPTLLLLLGSLSVLPILRLAKSKA